MQLDELHALYRQPFFDLIQQARRASRSLARRKVQLCTLLSIKTGGCSEDCGYCAQSARYSTGVQAERLMSTESVLEVAQRARANGSTRFCMGAAWKGVRDGDAKFEQVLETIREVSKLGMEVCVTLGQLSLAEARKLKDAGVTAYNHNIDTSPEFYPEIVTHAHLPGSREHHPRRAASGMECCCGGIIGMGETVDDRLKMLEVLTNFDPAPESVPINCLMAMPGTPLEDQPPVDVFELVRLIATTRIALPKAQSPPQRRPHPALARSPGALLLRRRQLDLLRRQTPHRRQPRRRCRRRTAARARPPHRRRWNGSAQAGA